MFHFAIAACFYAVIYVILFSSPLFMPLIFHFQLYADYTDYFAA